MRRITGVQSDLRAIPRLSRLDISSKPIQRLADGWLFFRVAPGARTRRLRRDPFSSVFRFVGKAPGESQWPRITWTLPGRGSSLDRRICRADNLRPAVRMGAPENGDVAQMVRATDAGRAPGGRGPERLESIPPGGQSDYHGVTNFGDVAQMVRATDS